VRRAQLCDLDLPRDSQAHRRVYASARADDGSLSSAYDGAGGEIKLGDPIMVRGRWAYDSAHTGYNEIHPVRTVQKTAPAPADADPFTAYLEFHKAWCLELANVPPDPPPSRDPQSATGNRRRPKHDGCAARHEGCAEARREPLGVPSCD